ncbi:MAG: flippase-like domain-containing protein [Deltaproteobacteria bacterium]|nr:flippase-like domain-containing protein [Deltaproteobacteria bacterium]
MKARTALAGLLGVTLAAGLAFWAVQRAGGARFVESLTSVAPWVLLPALLCEAVSQTCRAWKWTGLLSGIKHVPLSSALRAVLIGAAATHVVPLRLDELLRAKVLGDLEDIPPATVLATVAVDRVLEILVLGTLLGIISLFGPPPGALGAAFKVAWVAFLAGSVVLTAFVLAEERVVATLQRYAGPGAKLVGALATIATDMARGLRALPRGSALSRVLVGTVGEWTATVGIYIFVLTGFGLAAAPTTTLTLAVGGAAAYGVPNVPGAIGTFEAAQVTILEPLLSLPADEALAVAVLAHAVLMVPVTLIGAGVGLGIWLRPRA